MSQNKQSDLAYPTMMASVVGQVGCLNIFLIGLALGAGMLLDRVLGTNGIFAAVFILASVPIALWLTMRLSLQAITKVQKQAEKEQELKDQEQEKEDKNTEEI